MIPLEHCPEAVGSGETVASECQECGAEGYRSPYSPAYLCRDCWGDLVADLLDRDKETGISRLGCLDRLNTHDAFPVPDPMDDGRLILSAEVGRAPERYLKSISHVVKADCPRCGYDRAETVYQSMYSEFSETTTCRACGYLLDDRSSL